jgi:hypothetical protein
MRLCQDLQILRAEMKCPKLNTIPFFQRPSFELASQPQLHWMKELELCEEFAMLSSQAKKRLSKLIA